jgi:hypothetical protein
MDTSRSTDDPRDELRRVEEELAEIRRTAAELRGRIGEHADEPTDPAERATLITLAEEQESLIGVLEERREHLLRRLGQRS